MCIKYETLPLAVPLAVQQRADGIVIGDVTLVVVKATTKHTGGDHLSSHGTRFPLRHWVEDQAFAPHDHRHCLHFAPPDAARDGQLSSYGSHLLLCLPSVDFWSVGSRGARCFHDRATLPLCCLTCELGGKLPLQSELWRELKLPADALADGPAGLGFLPLETLVGDVDDLSRAVDLLLRQPSGEGPLWQRRVLLPRQTVPVGFEW